jgi:hypothetical protein
VNGVKYLVISILFFLFIFDPPFKFIPGTSGKIVVGLGFLWLASEILLKRNFFVTTRNLYLLGGSLFLYLFTCAIAILYGTRDFSLAKSYLFFIVECQLGASFLVYLTRKWLGDSPLVFFKIVVNITAVQAIFVIVMFLFPPVKDFIQSLLREDNLENITEMFEKGIIPAFRGLGLAKNVFYDFSVMQSFGLFSIVLISVYEGGKRMILYSVLYLLIIASVILSARSGLIGAALSFVLLFGVMFLRSTFYRSLKLYSSKFVRIFLLLTALIVAVVYISLPGETKTMITDEVVPFAFEMFVNNSDDGIKTESSEGLKNMYFKVETPTLIFGDGYFSDPYNPGQYYKMPDSGIMRHVLYYGLIGSLMIYLFWIIIFRVLIKDNATSTDRMPLMIFFILLMIYSFLIQVKGDFLANSFMGIKFLFLCFLFSNAGNIKLKHADEQS